ncbi:hypothetical protein Pint_34534 [Pistacia integerrima]|uniref:Uncharacterized protein n=1 Tax=Pistacia integerrima TaxID=434235 RepID=A0ACC0X6D2_9ROSI|nr:hypothetical protein Pint_34534 [Pistacia integerrima]
MKLLKVCPLFKHCNVKTIISTVQSHSYKVFSSTPRSNPTRQPQILSPNAPTENPVDITHEQLVNYIHSSQWHSIKHLAPKLTPALITTTLLSLHKTPDLALQFITHIDFSRVLDIKTRCLAVAIVSWLPSPKPTLQLLKETLLSGITSTNVLFDELALARDELSTESSIVFDLLISACCEMKRGDDAVNIGFNPTRLTYNALIQGLCKNQEGKLAEELLREMVSNGINPDDSTYFSLIEAIGNVGSVAETSDS